VNSQQDTRVQLLAHATVLIQCQGEALLTDPWHQRPAFGSWLPVPPLAVHPALVVALARSSRKFSILVSHGHDDHLDEEWLELFPPQTPVFIPRYPGDGLRQRLARIGFTAITEIDEHGARAGVFHLSAFRNPAISLDDAVVSVATPDALVVHANDNWQPLPAESVERIRRAAAGIPPERRLYMSQTSQADGFPAIFRPHSPEERREISRTRVESIVRSGLGNAAAVGARHFLSYASHAMPFVEGHPELLSTGYTTYEELRAIPGVGRVELVDLQPGDSFDFREVTRLFGSARLDDAAVKRSSVEYYAKRGVVDRCDTFRFREAVLEAPERQRLMREFLGGLNDFIMARVGSAGFWPGIQGKSVGLEDRGTGHRAGVRIGDGPLPADERPHALFVLEPPILDRMLLGELSWENVHVGYEGEVDVHPPGLHCGEIIRWMTRFSYAYRARAAGAAEGAPPC
jgi:hypothetical protein